MTTGWHSSEVGLDDLFGAPRVASGPARLPAVPAGRWLIGRLFFSVALGAVIYGLLYLARYAAPYPLLVVTIFVITVLRHIHRRLAICPLPPQITGRGIRPMEPGVARPQRSDPDADGLDLAVGQWIGRLERSGRDPTWFADKVQGRMGELVDERLRLRHGLTRASDPRRAREMMGEHLWKMLQDSSVGGTPRDMAQVVTRIEEL